jgi:hypothetical protein
MIKHTKDEDEIIQLAKIKKATVAHSLGFFLQVFWNFKDIYAVE